MSQDYGDFKRGVYLVPDYTDPRQEKELIAMDNEADLSELEDTPGRRFKPPYPYDFSIPLTRGILDNARISYKADYIESVEDTLEARRRRLGQDEIHIELSNPVGRDNVLN